MNSRLNNFSELINIKYNADIIKNNISGCGEITVLACVDSTNNYAKEKCRHGITDKSVIIAEKQTSGRGRQGKSFYSPQDGGIYMSIVLNADRLQNNTVQLMTVSASLAVCDAIETVCGVNAGIKWVNDIFVDNRKVCGILCEAVKDVDLMSVSHYIVGIGINIGNHDFPQDIKDIAGSIDCTDVNALVCEISNRLFTLLENTDSERLVERYREKLIVIGKNVHFEINGEKHSGTAFDVNESGNLLVKCENEVFTLSSGEISLESKNFAK